MAEVKLLRDSAEKDAFQAKVNRMMKLIINSLYKNKEVFSENLSLTLPTSWTRFVSSLSLTNLSLTLLRSS